eukprot:3440120-Amphidinium_carterae.2
MCIRDRYPVESNLSQRFCTLYVVPPSSSGSSLATQRLPPVCSRGQSSEVEDLGARIHGPGWPPGPSLFEADGAAPGRPSHWLSPSGGRHSGRTRCSALA